VKNDFLRDYLQGKQGAEDVAVTEGDQGMKSPCMVRFIPLQEVFQEEVASLLSGRGTHGR